MRECETEPAERQQTGHHKHRRTLPRSKTFMQTVQRLRPIQVYKSLLIISLSLFFFFELILESVDMGLVLPVL